MEHTRTCAAIDWLVEHPDAPAMARGALKAVEAAACDELEQLGPHRTPTLGHHLWCSILAALADVVEQTARVPGRVIDWASKTTARAIVEATLRLVLTPGQTRAAGGPSESGELPREAGVDPRARALLERVVARVVKGVLTTIVPQLDAATAVRTLRILAVLLCPAPDAHPAVWRGCLLPLARELSDDQITYLLDWVFAPIDDGGRRRPE